MKMRRRRMSSLTASRERREFEARHWPAAEPRWAELKPGCISSWCWRMMMMTMMMMMIMNNNENKQAGRGMSFSSIDEIQQQLSHYRRSASHNQIIHSREKRAKQISMSLLVRWVFSYSRVSTMSRLQTPFSLRWVWFLPDCIRTWWGDEDYPLEEELCLQPGPLLLLLETSGIVWAGVAFRPQSYFPAPTDYHQRDGCWQLELCVCKR